MSGDVVDAETQLGGTQHIVLDRLVVVLLELEQLRHAGLSVHVVE